MNFKSIMIAMMALCCMAPALHAQIQPGQAITISISGVPSDEKARFDLTYPVSESGMINMPLIGQVKAAGLRADELQVLLQSRYKAAGIYTQPTFQVIDSSAQKPVEQIVVVAGQVRRAGPVPYTRNLTLYQAIANAGGPTEFGSMHRVKLFREGKQRVYDLTKMESMQVLVKQDDTIEVPQKNLLGQ